MDDRWKKTAQTLGFVLGQPAKAQHVKPRPPVWVRPYSRSERSAASFASMRARSLAETPELKTRNSVMMEAVI